MTTLEEVGRLTNPELPIMFDLETIGLYGRIRLAQFYQPHFEVPLLVEYPDPLSLVALTTKLHIVGHNIHYDISTIQEQLGKLSWQPEKFDCTLLLARLFYHLRDGFSLDKVITYVVGTDLYAEAGIDKSAQQDSDWSAIVLSEEQKVYAAADVVYLQQVWDTVKPSLEDYSYKLDLLCTQYCLDFQNNGMPVDIKKLEARFVANTEKIKELAVPINVNSYQQVRPYISSIMSDGEGLARLALQGNERADKVNKTRKLIKNNSFLTKFSSTMDDLGNGFGTIYGKFVCSARSGRTTSKDQNLQQLPRNLKGIFGVREEGDTVLIYSDFAQIQLRAVCAQTGDKKMESLFRNGDDLHSYVAHMIFGATITKKQRQISKTANFGLLFGAGINVFIAILIKQANIWLEEEEAKSIKKKWNALWVQITEWQKRGIKDWKKGAPWETVLGRKYKAKMMTDQLAMQIQGFEAEVAKLAMHYMIPKLKELNAEIKLCDFIHDSYIFKCPNSRPVYVEACEIIANSMQEAWVQISQNAVITDLPMPVNVRVGFNWGDIEDDIFIHEHIQ